MSTVASRKRRSRHVAQPDDQLRVELERDGSVAFEEALAPDDDGDTDADGHCDDVEDPAIAMMAGVGAAPAVAHAVEMCSAQIRALDQQVDELRQMHASLQAQVTALHDACATLREGLLHVQANAIGSAPSFERFEQRVARIEQCVARSRKAF